MKISPKVDPFYHVIRRSTILALRRSIYDMIADESNLIFICRRLSLQLATVEENSNAAQTGLS